MILPPYRARPKHPASREGNSSGTHSSVLPWGKKIGNLQNSFTFKVLFFKFDIKIWLRYIFQIDQSRRNWIKHWNQCKWISIELCNCITLRILSLSYLSDYLTRSDSTDCKRIPREENTYCNRLHYQKLSCSCTFSASEESQITIRPCKPLYFSVLNYTLRVLVAGVYYLVIIVKDSSIIKINFMGKIFYFEMNFLSI